jgi:hypothetical protein
MPVLLGCREPDDIARTDFAAMTHIAITENLDGKNTDWMEKVTDEQYPKS